MKNKLLAVESSFHFRAWNLKFTEMTKGYAIGQSSFGRLWHVGTGLQHEGVKECQHVVLQPPAP